MTLSKHSNDEVSGSMREARNGLVYFLIGGAIGATVALLFAPKSGVDLRGDISDLTKKGYDETVELAHQLKEQSADVLHTIKEKTDKVYDLAAARFSLVKEAFDGPSMEKSDKKINGISTEGEVKPIEQQTGSSRRSSNIV